MGIIDKGNKSVSVYTKERILTNMNSFNVIMWYSQTKNWSCYYMHAFVLLNKKHHSILEYHLVIVLNCLVEWYLRARCYCYHWLPFGAVAMLQLQKKIFIRKVTAAYCLSSKRRHDAFKMVMLIFSSHALIVTSNCKQHA